MNVPAASTVVCSSVRMRKQRYYYTELQCVSLDFPGFMSFFYLEMKSTQRGDVLKLKNFPLYKFYVVFQGIAR